VRCSPSPCSAGCITSINERRSSVVACRPADPQDGSAGGLYRNHEVSPPQPGVRRVATCIRCLVQPEVSSKAVPFVSVFVMDGIFAPHRCSAGCITSTSEQRSSVVACCLPIPKTDRRMPLPQPRNRPYRPRFPRPHDRHAMPFQSLVEPEASCKAVPFGPFSLRMGFLRPTRAAVAYAWLCVMCALLKQLLLLGPPLPRVVDFFALLVVTGGERDFVEARRWKAYFD